MDRPRIAHVWRGVIDLIFAIVAIVALWQYLGSGVIGAEYVLLVVIVLALAFNATYRGPEPQTTPPVGPVARSEQPSAPGPRVTSLGPVEVGALPPRRTGSVVWVDRLTLQPGGHRSQLVDLRKGEHVRGRIYEVNGKLDFTWAFTDLANSSKADRGQPYKAVTGGEGSPSYDIDFILLKDEQLWLELSVGERDVPRSIQVELQRV